MKLTTALMSLVLVSQVYAHDSKGEFKRVQYEHDKYRDYTREELEVKIGSDKALLPYYACNGRDEFDPFHKPLRTNPEGNSLKIKGYKSDELVTYKQGRYFDVKGKELKDLSHDTFYKYIVKAMSRLEKLDSASKLIRHLEESYFPLTIEFGGNRFMPYAHGKPYQGIFIAGAISFFDTLRFTSEESAVFDAIGTGGSIAWHPTMKLETTEADGKVRVLDPDVALAHEMYHAFDSIRGLLDQRGVIGSKFENTNVTEYRASYFENLVRGELGIRYRKYYSEGIGDADLLDENQEPYFISSPCLK